MIANLANKWIKIQFSKVEYLKIFLRRNGRFQKHCYSRYLTRGNSTHLSIRKHGWDLLFYFIFCGNIAKENRRSALLFDKSALSKKYRNENDFYLSDENSQQISVIRRFFPFSTILFFSFEKNFMTHPLYGLKKFYREFIPSCICFLSNRLHTLTPLLLPRTFKSDRHLLKTEKVGRNILNSTQTVSKQNRSRKTETKV